ncbi:MAG: isoleucine--tRNA ligase [Actinomycetota bacterium]|nr:isoleucine--tRNA ligase [Actinomycetota bacterium]
MARYRPVDPKVEFPALEQRVLEFWRGGSIFDKSLKLREGAPEWTFYEGPPTANGKPGIHHVEPRTFKDLYPRYKTMTGHLVRRKAGWDCHGLPVELEVEKEIGTKSKRDIEAFGVAEFNRLCRESVGRYVNEFERLTERIGYWIDMGDAYWTLSPEYIESVWWSLKTLYERGLLFRDFRSVAYCPRCGTALSDHEVAQGYTHVVDPGVTVEFPVTEPSRPELAGASFLGWTTTPWTLPSNLGLAVDPDQPYVVASVGRERYIVAEALMRAVLGEDAVIEYTLRGSDLVGSRYSPPYDNMSGDTHRVVAAGFVLMDEGTGIVHIAPGYGADDLDIGRREGWPVYSPVDDFGNFTDQAPAFVRGRFVKEADADIVADLRERGLLFAYSDYEHTYPLCWRCKTPLLYVARTSWYVRTTAKKDRLLEVNEGVDWHPEHIKHGRYGDWLENNVDWALSRERYWGTPLPLWVCGGDHVTPVGSLRELSDLAGRDVTSIDPHRPDVDEVEIPCRECGATARRVPEVIDTWYDAGAMPYAQWSYHPDLGRGLQEFSERFPADFISEAIDQTRGWFYTLMAEAVLLFDDTAYRHVVCLGHLVDREGRKMSKSVGNQLDPWTVLDRHGADALRWYLITVGSPWASRRVYFEALDEVVRQFLLTLWNVYSFYVTYANVDGFDPSSAVDVPVARRPPLDRWVLSQLAQTVREARDGLESYDATAAGRRIARFIDDLSNWYVRRARRRFWSAGRGAEATDKAAAYLTLNECLVTVARLLAPFTPFVTEELWQNLAAGTDGAPESVHLADYPEVDEGAVDPELDARMEAVRDVVSLGRTIRTDAKVRVRQPLARAVLHYPGDREGLTPLLDLVKDELNVKRVEFAESAEQFGRWQAKPSYRVLGPRLGPQVKDVAAALADDDGRLAAALARGETVTLRLGERVSVELAPDEVDLVQETREGWGVGAEGGLTVALDLEVTPDLRQEGLAREVVRLVQDARKSAGLDVTDRIELGIEAPDEVVDAVEKHHEYVSRETLATGLQPRALSDPEYDTTETLDGKRIRITLRRRTGTFQASSEIEPPVV